MNLAVAHRAVAGIIALLVLIQAYLAGDSSRLFGGGDIVIHGIVGNTSFALAVIALGLAIALRDRRHIGVAAALVILMTAQIGLGYAGRTSLPAASWHIPLGVAIFGLSVYQVVLAGLGATPARGGR